MAKKNKEVNHKRACKQLISLLLKAEITNKEKETIVQFFFPKVLKRSLSVLSG